MSQPESPPPQGEAPPRPGDAERALVARIAARDQSALAALYDRTAAAVHGVARRILVDEHAAEEITLATFTQVWRTAESYDPARGSVPAWLVTIARSRALDARRAREVRDVERTPLHESVEAAAAADTQAAPAEDAAAEVELGSALESALAHLAAPQRRAIQLAFLRGMSHTAVAETLGLPLGTVKSQIRRGLLELRQHLQAWESVP